MTRLFGIARLAITALGFAVLAGGTAAGSSSFAQIIQQIEALPYQPNYTPVRFDSAFAPTLVANDAPAENYTSGSIYSALNTPASPDAPDWPTAFRQVILHR